MLGICESNCKSNHAISSGQCLICYEIYLKIKSTNGTLRRPRPLRLPPAQLFAAFNAALIRHGRADSINMHSACTQHALSMHSACTQQADLPASLNTRFRDLTVPPQNHSTKPPQKHASVAPRSPQTLHSGAAHIERTATRAERRVRPRIQIPGPPHHRRFSRCEQRFFPVLGIAICRLHHLVG